MNEIVKYKMWVYYFSVSSKESIGTMSVFSTDLYVLGFLESFLIIFAIMSVLNLSFNLLSF